MKKKINDSSCRFHDEKRLQQSEDFALSYDGKVAKLVIDEVLFPEDSGIYKLVAENSKGKTSTQCKVTIHGEKILYGTRLSEIQNGFAESKAVISYACLFM